MSLVLVVGMPITVEEAKAIGSSFVEAIVVAETAALVTVLVVKFFKTMF